MTDKKIIKKKKTLLLSSDNPQIAKGYGDEHVQTYIEAMPEWKRYETDEVDEEQFNQWVKQASKLPGEKV